MARGHAILYGIARTHIGGISLELGSTEQGWKEPREPNTPQ